MFYQNLLDNQALKNFPHTDTPIGLIDQNDNPNEFVKELVRGLDDDSTQDEITSTKNRIVAVVDH